MSGQIPKIAVFELSPSGAEAKEIEYRAGTLVILEVGRKITDHEQVQFFVDNTKKGHVTTISLLRQIEVADYIDVLKRVEYALAAHSGGLLHFVVSGPIALSFFCAQLVGMHYAVLISQFNPAASNYLNILALPDGLRRFSA